MLTEDNLKIIMGSKLNVKKVNPSCLFVRAILGYEPSNIFEDSQPRSDNEASDLAGPRSDNNKSSSKVIREDVKACQVG